MHSLSYLVNIAMVVYLAISAPKYGKSSVLWAVLGVFLGALAMSIFFFKTNRPVAGALWLVAFILQVIMVVIAIVALVALSACQGGC